MNSRCHDIIIHTRVKGWYVIDDPEAYTGHRRKLQSCFHAKRYMKEHEKARNDAISIDYRLKNPSNHSIEV